MTELSTPKVTRSSKAKKRVRRTTSSSRAESSLFVNSVEKAFRVLSVFSSKHRQLSLAQIASLADLDMSATQRFTHTLTELGLLHKDPNTKRYSLAPRMLEFSHHYIASNQLVTIATPYLQHLSHETEESVSLTILDGSDIVYVQRLISRHVLTADVTVGTRLPAYCTSAGLAIMSALPEADVNDILEQSELVPYTNYTVHQPQAILKRLEQFRQQGYAHTEDEYYLGDIATAVAITDETGYPIGAINIGVTRTRWNGPEDEHRLASLLIAAGRAISSYS